jgi:chromosome segregation and condensation protein ScpB
MDNEELIKEINMLKEELEKTKTELIETKEHLKKYTAPSNMKKYYLIITKIVVSFVCNFIKSIIMHIIIN